MNWYMKWMVFVMFPICLFGAVQFAWTTATEPPKTNKCNCCCHVDDCNVSIVREE